MTACFATQIELDDRGVAWIGGTKVKVTEVVLDKIAYGWSPEEIHFQHPHLSLAQIHGALTYYYENQSGLDAQIRRGLDESGKLASQVSDADLQRRVGPISSYRHVLEYPFMFYMDVHSDRAPSRLASGRAVELKCRDGRRKTERRILDGDLPVSSTGRRNARPHTQATQDEASLSIARMERGGY